MTPQSTARGDFSKAMALLAVSLGFELDEPTVGVYWHRLRGIPSEVRREAFGRAADRKWFKLPQPGELLELSAQVVKEKRDAAARLHLAGCEHSGHWQCDERGDVIGRCACWTAAQHAVAQVGQAIALPEATYDSRDEA